GPRHPSHHHRARGRSHLRAGRRARRRGRRPRHPGRARGGVRGPLPPAGDRGRARGDLMADDLQVETELGKAYDARLLRRLWDSVRPYRGAFWGALGLSAVQQAFGLVQPYFVKRGIDRYIAAGDAAGLRRLGLVYAAALLGEVTAAYFQQHLTMV